MVPVSTGLRVLIVLSFFQSKHISMSTDYAEVVQRETSKVQITPTQITRYTTE